MNNKWSESDLCILRSNYGQKTCEEISALLGRTRYAVQAKAMSLGLKTDRLKMIGRYHDLNQEKYTTRNRICQECGDKFISNHNNRSRCFNCFPFWHTADRGARTIEEKYPGGYKICCLCNQKLSLDCFSIRSNKQKNITLDSYCKPCKTEIGTTKKRQLKSLAVEYKGGSCNDCKQKFIDAVFDFHHLDETKKDFIISKKSGLKLSEQVKNELDKCVLLCANCHRTRHAIQNRLIGTPTRTCT